jgi:hypothetical protein
MGSSLQPRQTAARSRARGRIAGIGSKSTAPSQKGLNWTTFVAIALVATPPILKLSPIKKIAVAVLLEPIWQPRRIAREAMPTLVRMSLSEMEVGIAAPVNARGRLRHIGRR